MEDECAMEDECEEAMLSAPKSKAAPTRKKQGDRMTAMLF
jgi:hypothetical protein